MMLTAHASAACVVADGSRLQALGHRMLEDSVALRFGEARMRVPAFGSWAYDWTQSYVTSYRIIGRAIAQFGHAAGQGMALPPAEALAYDLAAPVRQAFAEIVTRPSLGDGVFTADMAHLAATLAAEAGQPARAAALEQALRLEPAGRLAEAAGTATIFMRSMRPLAARLGTLVLRIGEAGSVVAFGSYFGYSAIGTPGVLVGALGGMGLAWGVDWIINRLDASLNRPAFEAQALLAIDMAQAGVLAEGRAAISVFAAARPAPCP